MKLTQSKMLSLIVEKPGLYIGHGSVERAKAFLNGYTAGCGEIDDTYRDFTAWVADRFSIVRTDDWATVIANLGKTEAESFELLKSLWSEYLGECRNDQ